jgi:hypothetical protein
MKALAALAVAIATTGGACSGGGAGSSMAGSGGSGPAVNASGGAPGPADAGVTGSGGSDGSGGGNPGSGGAIADANSASDAPVANEDGAAAKGPFTCTTYIGSVLTTEWWPQGFETIVDNTKWQLKWHHHGYIEAWGDPQSPFWADTGDPNNLASGSPIQSPCKDGSTAPDRVVFLAIDWVLLTEKDWTDWLEKDLVAIKSKYPSVRWVDIMPTVRCPQNKMCNPNAKPGPGANDGAGPEDCFIPPFEDAAIAKVVAAHADWVGLGPIVEATMCNGGYGAHLTAADAKHAAMAIGAFYATRP